MHQVCTQHSKERKRLMYQVFNICWHLLIYVVDDVSTHFDKNQNSEMDAPPNLLPQSFLFILPGANANQTLYKPGKLDLLKPKHLGQIHKALVCHPQVSCCSSKNGIMWLRLIPCMVLKWHSWVICVTSFTYHGDFPFSLMAYLNSGTYLILLILKKVSNLAGKGDKLMVCLGLANCGQQKMIF